MKIMAHKSHSTMESSKPCALGLFSAVYERLAARMSIPIPIGTRTSN